MIKQFFEDFKDQMLSLDLRNEIIVEQVPPPTKLAPFAFAVTARAVSSSWQIRNIKRHGKENFEQLLSCELL
jgi:hypothetical protein